MTQQKGTQMIEAEYIGTDSTHGFHTGEFYRLESVTMDELIWVRSESHLAQKAYKTLKDVLSDWKIIKA